ncbi:hypothetical protein Hdeb2414_s0016g00492891 [Helianthus debilis subsp. tardiflorus]
MRTEYKNAQLGCSATNELAKLLAYDVIGSEEKVHVICNSLYWPCPNLLSRDTLCSNCCNFL